MHVYKRCISKPFAVPEALPALHAGLPLHQKARSSRQGAILCTAAVHTKEGKRNG